MSKDKTKIIVTLGPSTSKEEDLRRLKDKGVDFVRTNMSHSSIEEMKYFLSLAKKVGIPFIIDTEGSQIRSGYLEKDKIDVEEGNELRVYDYPTVGNNQRISLKPKGIVKQLEEGDLIHIDFDTAILRVSDISTISQGYIKSKVITSGSIGKNKAVVINPSMDKKFNLPTLSEKDLECIRIGLENNVDHIAISFTRSGEAVEEVRRITKNKMKIISKIECIEALENLDDIIDKSDFLLIDRGDLSKEIPMEKIPFTQKIILNKANKKDKGVYVATNLLETMIEKKYPTRAEVHDILATINDGAYGLTLAAETAIGKHPIECVNMLNKLIEHAHSVNGNDIRADEKFIEELERVNYLSNIDLPSSLTEPHGGKLVNRILKEIPEESYLNSLEKIELNKELQMDVEQIAIGTFSPIEGFMCKNDFQGVLDNMRLSNGVIWPLPIILDVSEEKADKLEIGKDIALTNEEDEIIGLLNLEEKYNFDKEETVKKLYGTSSEEHPGVRNIMGLNPLLLGGKISLIRRKNSETKQYELTPRQVRRLFEERGWSKVVGFHTRNVIHRSHEFIQLKAMEKENCDGLFVHPVIGKKKPGDFNSKYIINSYELMTKHFYPRNKVVFATFSTFSRYAGPREALFTALCRKNFGCSHFIVGRDHTGVGNFYDPKASHEIFDKFPNLGIVPVRFDKVFYSEKLKDHVHETEDSEHDDNNKLHISGTQARKMFENKQTPPEWFMRPEISNMIIDSLNNGEEVFVK